MQIHTRLQKKNTRQKNYIDELFQSQLWNAKITNFLKTTTTVSVFEI